MHSLAFMQRILERSATGQKTHWPPSIIKMLEAPEGTPYVPTVAEARYESETVICGCLREVRAQQSPVIASVTHLNPSLPPSSVSPCCISCWTASSLTLDALTFSSSTAASSAPHLPSLPWLPTDSTCALMYVRPFAVSHLPPPLEYCLSLSFTATQVRSYNLSGMGCSAGVIAIDLAKQLLTNRPNSIAVVVSTENLTQVWLVVSLLPSFLCSLSRTGTALPRCIRTCTSATSAPCCCRTRCLGLEALLLLSRHTYRMASMPSTSSSTLFALRTLRFVTFNHTSTHTCVAFPLTIIVMCCTQQDAAYGCVYEQEDPKGFRGIHLSKDITKIAGKALTANLTILGSDLHHHHHEIQYTAPAPRSLTPTHSHSPEILTLREQGKVLLSMAARRVTKLLKAWGEKNNWKWGQRIAVVTQ